MKIATWNIQGVVRRQALLLCWLREAKPDLVALQKINVPEQKFPTPLFARAGYCSEVHTFPEAPRRRDYGVAILSRKEPPCVKKGLPGQEPLGPRLLTVEVDGLEFSSVYAPAGDRRDIQSKLDWFDSLIAHLKTSRARSADRVLCGDFNVVPPYRYGPRGAVRSSLNYHGDVQARFGALLEEGGLCDLYARRPPMDWVDPFRFKSRSGCLKFSRLEYVLATRGIVDRDPVVEFDVDHAIVKNGPFYWVRAPIVADLSE